MTRFDDAKTMKMARQTYFAGMMAMLPTGGEFSATKAESSFQKHWRFIHCTKCQNRIVDDDVGNVIVDASTEIVTSHHRACPSAVCILECAV